MREKLIKANRKRRRQMLAAHLLTLAHVATERAGYTDRYNNYFNINRNRNCVVGHGLRLIGRDNFGLDKAGTYRISEEKEAFKKFYGISESDYTRIYRGSIGTSPLSNAEYLRNL